MSQGQFPFRLRMHHNVRLFYKYRCFQGVPKSKYVKPVTFSRVEASAGCVCRAPRSQYEAKSLHGQVRRQYQQPGDGIRMPDLACQQGKEVTIAAATIFAEDQASNGIDRCRKQHCAHEQ